MLKFKNITIIGTSHVARQSLKEVKDGTLQIEICSLDECIAMSLEKKYCEPINELGEILFDIYDYYS